MGSRRIMKTLGERLGAENRVPARGASSGIAAAGAIGVAGLAGCPVSTTQGVARGISEAGAGVREEMPRRIATARANTPRMTIVISRGLFLSLVVSKAVDCRMNRKPDSFPPSPEMSDSLRAFRQIGRKFRGSPISPEIDLMTGQWHAITYSTDWR
jgi:hypothetical protein